MNMDDEERSRLVFKETEELQQLLLQKSKTQESKSNVFHYINTILNLFIIALSLVSSVLTGIDTPEMRIPVIVFTALIFAISTTIQTMRLGPRGYNYRQGSIRLKRILGQVRDILYMFHTYTTEQVLTFLSSFRTEIDEIDLDLYQNSIAGASGGEMHIPPSQNSHDSESHIHIHIENGKESGKGKEEERDERDEKNDNEKKMVRSTSLPTNKTEKEELRRVDSEPIIKNSPLFLSKDDSSPKMLRKSIKDFNDIL